MEDGKRFNYDFNRRKKTQKNEEKFWIKSPEKYGPILMSLFMNEQVFFLFFDCLEKT